MLATKRQKALLALTVILLIAFVVVVGTFIVPDRAADLWMDAAEGALQLAVVTVIGGAVAATYRRIDSDRERRRARDELRFEIFQQLSSGYQQLRRVRRNLKFAGIHILQSSSVRPRLRPEQIAMLRDGMVELVQVTTMLEQITQELDVRIVFDRREEMFEALFKIVAYNERLIHEWQKRGVEFWDAESGDVRDLPALAEFLADTQVSFRPNVRVPYDDLIRAVQQQLLQQSRKRGLSAPARGPSRRPACGAATR